MLFYRLKHIIDLLVVQVTNMLHVQKEKKNVSYFGQEPRAKTIFLCRFFCRIWLFLRGRTVRTREYVLHVVRVRPRKKSIARRHSVISVE